MSLFSVIVQILEDPHDQEFMETLYLSYERLMYAEIKKILRNDWDTEDVQQATLLRLINRVSVLRTLEKPQLVDYIVTASRHTAYNYIRDHKRGSEFSFDETMGSFESGYESGDDRLVLVETLQDVHEAWQTLDPRSRWLLEAKYILDEPNEAIAREIGVSPNSVRMLLTRARKKLKEQLESAE